MRRCGIAAVGVLALAGARLQCQASAGTPNEAAQAAFAEGEAALAANHLEQAITSYLKAERLDPTLWLARFHLIRAYAEAGKLKQRDAQRETLRKLRATGKYPDLERLSGFLLENFQCAGRKVSVAEYLKPTGRSNTYYQFSVFSGEKVDLTISLESSNFDQIFWAKKHPDLAARGERLFSLDGDSDRMHMTYKFFDGQPSYDLLRSTVVDILTGGAHALSTNETGPLLPDPPLE